MGQVSSLSLSSWRGLQTLAPDQVWTCCPPRLFDGWISSHLCPFPSSTWLTEIRTFLNPAVPHLLGHIKLLILTAKAVYSSSPGQPSLHPQTLEHSMLNSDHSSSSQTFAFFPPGLCSSGWQALPHPFAACPLRSLLLLAGW